MSYTYTKTGRPLPCGWAKSVGAGKRGIFIQHNLDGSYQVKRGRIEGSTYAQAWTYEHEWTYTNEHDAWNHYLRMKNLYYGFGGWPYNVLVLGGLVVVFLIMLLLVVGTMWIFS